MRCRVCLVSWCPTTTGRRSRQRCPRERGRARPSTFARGPWNSKKNGTSNATSQRKPPCSRTPRTTSARPWTRSDVSRKKPTRRSREPRPPRRNLLRDTAAGSWPSEHGAPSKRLPWSFDGTWTRRHWRDPTRSTPFDVNSRRRARKFKPSNCAARPSKPRTTPNSSEPSPTPTPGQRPTQRKPPPSSKISRPSSIASAEPEPPTSLNSTSSNDTRSPSHP
mmetsp:Transcript_20712/g.66659  ORF Transcript_20712/g.66659 Transcript_20712/m.66659 type:complete len:221 (-) Transcript_20712:67-729(-)